MSLPELNLTDLGSHTAVVWGLLWFHQRTMDKKLRSVHRRIRQHEERFAALERVIRAAFTVRRAAPKLAP